MLLFCFDLPMIELRNCVQERTLVTQHDEARLLRLCFPSIKESYPLANHQHGFHPLNSTTKVLHAISTHISQRLK